MHFALLQTAKEECAMANELYQRLDDLVMENKELTIKLELSNSEIANLRIEVKRLEDGQLELSVKLDESKNEIGRLGMRLKHHYADLADKAMFGQ